MSETWKPIAGFESRYEVSDCGRVRSVPFMQRYLLRNGMYGYRRKRSKILAQQRTREGYIIVHLHLDNVRTVRTVHSLVAEAFITKTANEVNHIDGDKTYNHVSNLEWVTRRANHLHAVAIGLNHQALRVKDPMTGHVYASVAQAAKAVGKSHRTVRATFEVVAS